MTPARAQGVSRLWPRMRPTVRHGLDAPEHDGTLRRSGFPSVCSFAYRYNIRHCRVHRSLRGRAVTRRNMVSEGFGAAMSLSRSADVAGGFARLPRPVPAGTTFTAKKAVNGCFRRQSGRGPAEGFSGRPHAMQNNSQLACDSHRCLPLADALRERVAPSL